MFIWSGIGLTQRRAWISVEVTVYTRRGPVGGLWAELWNISYGSAADTCVEKAIRKWNMITGEALHIMSQKRENQFFQIWVQPTVICIVQSPILDKFWYGRLLKRLSVNVHKISIRTLESSCVSHVSNPVYHMSIFPKQEAECHISAVEVCVYI